MLPGPDGEQERIRKRFSRIASKLSYLDLHRIHDAGARLDLGDLESPAALESSGSMYFLGYYTVEGVRTALEAYGLLPKLRQRGWDGFEVRLEIRDRSDQRFRLYGDGHGLLGALLAEAIVHEGTVAIPDATISSGEASAPTPKKSLEVVFLEWVLLQSPSSSFDATHPRLPGQRFPGLGVGREVIELIYRMGIRLGRDGLVNFPYYFHNAVLYRSRFRFANPDDEGKVSAYFRDLAALTLADASWAFELGCVFDRASGEPVEWKAAELVLPLNDAATALFGGEVYASRARDLAEGTAVRFDADLFAERRAAEERRFQADVERGAFVARVRHPLDPDSP